MCIYPLESYQRRQQPGLSRLQGSMNERCHPSIINCLVGSIKLEHRAPNSHQVSPPGVQKISSYLRIVRIVRSCGITIKIHEQNSYVFGLPQVFVGNNIIYSLSLVLQSSGTGLKNVITSRLILLVCISSCRTSYIRE